MRKNLVITVTAEDRPGIVELITEVLLNHGGNLEESRMSRLGGEFAGILLTSVAEERADGLVAEYESLAQKEIFVTVKTAHGACLVPDRGGVLHEIELSGVDHEGIVHGITDYLADHGVNIEEMETDMVHAPVTGTPLFTMRALVVVPESLGTIELRDRLNEIGDRLGVDILVKPVRR